MNHSPPPPVQDAPVSVPRPSFARRLGRGGLFVLAALWPLAVFEMLVEAAGLAPPKAIPLAVLNPGEDHMFRDEGAGFQFSSRFLWEPKPGGVFSEGVVNEQNRRGPIVPYDGPGRLRIITLGDSSTFGLNVKDDECFSRRLETRIRERGIEVDVVNLGCVGYSAIQALERYRQEGRLFAPQIVIVAVGAINDQFTATGGMTDRGKIAHYTQGTMQVKEFCERFSAFRWLEFVLSPKAREFRTASSARSSERVPLDDFERAVLELDAEVRADGANLLVVVPPRRKDAESVFPKCLAYTERLRRTVAQHSLTAIDAFAIFRERDDADPRVHATPESSPLFCDSFHPSVAGHELYATLLLSRIDELGWLESGRAR